MAKTLFHLAVCVAAISHTASAAILVHYDVNQGGENSNMLAYESVFTGVSATSLSLTGTGMNTSASSNTIFVSFSNAPSTPGSHYIEFTLTPAVTGVMFNLTALTFNYYYDGSGSSSSGDAFWSLSAAINGGDFTPVGTNPVATINNNNSVPSPLPSVEVPLGQTDVTSAVFRLYLHDDGGASTTTYIKTGAITLTGDVVPEPGAALLALLGGAVISLQRRRRLAL